MTTTEGEAQIISLLKEMLALEVARLSQNGTTESAANMNAALLNASQRSK